jgi:hypothetical protein
MKHLQHTSGTSETLEAYACNMSVAILLGGGHHVRHIGDGAKSTTGLTATSFFYWGHRGVRSLDGSVKHGTAATPSRSPTAGGGDEEDVGAGSDDEGRGGWQAWLQRRNLASQEASEGPGVEEAEVIAAGEGERKASGKERCEGCAS